MIRVAACLCSSAASSLTHPVEDGGVFFVKRHDGSRHLKVVGVPERSR